MEIFQDVHQVFVKHHPKVINSRYILGTISIGFNPVGAFSAFEEICSSNWIILPGENETTTSDRGYPGRLSFPDAARERFSK